MPNIDLRALTADIVAAHVSNNKIAVNDLADTITMIYGALANLGTPVAPIVEKPVPAVPIKSSVKPHAITCLICGATQKALKRHLGSAHRMTPDAYRTAWKLPSDYPMVSLDYKAIRSEIAKGSGLGRKKAQ